MTVPTKTVVVQVTVAPVKAAIKAVAVAVDTVVTVMPTRALRRVRVHARVAVALLEMRTVDRTNHNANVTKLKAQPNHEPVS